MCHSKQTAAPGALTEVRWEQGGNKPGSHYKKVPRSDETGELLLTVYSSDIYYQPYTVSVYRADAEALEQLQNIANRYQMAAWNGLPPDRDNIMLDGLFTDITLIFSGERITISYESKLPEGALDSLREFTGCLNRWATDERLLERHSEDRQPRK